MSARRVAHLPIPATTFVKGRSERPAEGWADVAVDDDDAFAWGCDLFDAGCYFEAHELWERCWLQARDRLGVDADDTRFLHGLIRLTAGGVKLLDDNPTSRIAHVDGAVGYFAGLQHTIRGISPTTWQRAIDDLRAGRAPTLRPSLSCQGRS